ncbi:cytochrome c oxidase subunit IV [Thermaerobacter marianensis DSM 12885]|uniref:Cytochrome c oxidase subunit IV n=1 Tax=Thermaerobacter marianensis (strain ATCC 700841 / DSM 12885 / JCM 10246 / 7p75a) TaxID=644966 RepID=E6SGB2_THEM7|nr:cytochrome C oxidase subunit IV family protein [Thermaerobacter marianensis]ADU50529.1 cytochrome c oxidase subunit IV [Thermaerobacter marianensis DSM 12885]
MSGTAHSAVEHGHEHDHGNRLYFLTWLWLLLITVLEVGVVLVHMPRAILVAVLLLMTVLKSGLIVANFMHLRFEKLNMIYIILTPMIFALIMWYGVALDY